MNVIVEYALTIWFFFYLFNHADISYRLRQWIIARVPSYIAYAIQCSFCSSCYLTFALWLLFPISPWTIFVAPVINLFVELAYKKLTNV